jgi:AcrR family transcriptional regulator
VTEPISRDGTALRAAGLRTRAELLSALADAMAAIPWKRLSVRGVAAEAYLSPAAFWRYFEDLESGVVALAEERAPVPGHVLRVLTLIAAEGYPGARRALAAATTPTTERPDL